MALETIDSNPVMPHRERPAGGVVPVFQPVHVFDTQRDMEKNLPSIVVCELVLSSPASKLGCVSKLGLRSYRTFIAAGIQSQDASKLQDFYRRRYSKQGSFKADR